MTTTRGAPVPPELMSFLEEEMSEIFEDIADANLTNQSNWEKLDHNDFVVGTDGEIVIPHHGWDLNESNIEVYTHNLKEVRSVEVMLGPGFTIYRKTSANPAYVVFLCEDEVSWMEIP